MKMFASALTVLGLVSMGSASFAMESGNCSKAVYQAAVGAARQAENSFGIVGNNLHFAGAFERSSGEIEVNFYDYPYEITVDVYVNANGKVVGTSERDNFRTVGGGN
jgi:hypothetical protein